MFLDQAYEQHPFIQFYALECAANICSNNEGVEQFLQQNNVVPNLVRLINGKYNGIIDSVTTSAPKIVQTPFDTSANSRQICSSTSQPTPLFCQYFPGGCTQRIGLL